MSFVYVHVPFCKTICSYCDFVRCGYHQGLADKWLQAIQKEIKEKLRNEKITTLYLGGGTPTSLTIAQMEVLLECLGEYSADVEEYTVEANVESLDDSMLDLLAGYGVNRISLGVQSIDATLIKRMNRHHDKQMVIDTIQRIHHHGIHNISCDLIYGLPTQTPALWQEDLRVLCEQDIQHISLYALTIEEHSAFGREKVAAMEEDEEADFYEAAITYLRSQGFEQYEISNFARHKHYSKHNQAYWHYEDFIGIGCGASGKQKHARYDNTRNLETYLRQGPSPSYIALTSKDERFEMIMMGLRLTQGISLSKFSKRFGCELLSCYENAVQKNIRLGLLRMENGFIKATDKGLHVLNSVLLDFMEG